MKKMHYYKWSYVVFYTLLVVILLALSLFFGIGYGQVIDGHVYPLNTDVLLFVVYGMVILAILVFLGAIILRFIRLWIQNRKRTFRLFVAIFLLVTLLLVCRWLASSTPLMVGEKEYHSIFWLQMADTLLYSIYFLLFFSILCVGCSALGVCRRIHFKKS